MSALGLSTLNELACAQSQEDLRGKLVRVGQMIDFGLVTATLLNRDTRGQVSIQRFGIVPRGWESAAADPAACERDPVLLRNRISFLPVVYDQTLYVEAGAADLWEQQAAFGYRTGISICLRPTDNQRFHFGVDREQHLPADDAGLLGLMGEVRLIADYTLASVLAMSPAPGEIPAAPELNAQDLEILKWSAEGKSAWTIGQLLSTAESAVNRRLGVIRGKFGVATKAQAIAKAVAHGLI